MEMLDVFVCTVLIRQTLLGRLGRQQITLDQAQTTLDGADQNLDDDFLLLSLYQQTIVNAPDAGEFQIVADRQGIFVSCEAAHKEPWRGEYVLNAVHEHVQVVLRRRLLHVRRLRGANVR